MSEDRCHATNAWHRCAILFSVIRHPSSLYTLDWLSASRSLDNGFRCSFVVHPAPRPGNRDDRATRRRFAIGKVEAGAGPLQKRLGDEYAEAQAAGFAFAPRAPCATAGGEVRFPDPRD